MKKIPKVLYISYDGMTDPLGQSQVMPYLSGLSKVGYEIHIVSFEKTEAFRQSGQQIRKIIQDRGLQWYPQKYTSKPPVLSSLKDVRRMYRVTFRLHKNIRFDIVHARSYIPALVALKLKRKKGVSFVFDMRGFWADERVDGKIWNLRNALYRRIYQFFKKKERVFFSFADAVVSLTHAAVPHIRVISERTDLNPDVIPCCADLDHFHPAAVDENRKDTLRKELGIGGHDKVLSYLGSLGTWYMNREMFEFFRLAKDEGIFDKLLIINRDDRGRVLKEATESGIETENIVIVPATREEVPALISISSANVFFIKPCFSKAASSPTKFAEVLGMGVPVIANSGVGDIEQQILDTGTGIVLKDFSAEEMKNAIMKWKAMEVPKAEICRNAALKYFDLKQGVDKYRDIYERVLKVDA